MEEQVSFKQVYDLIGASEIRISAKVDKVYDAFMRLEEGKVTQLLTDMAEVKAQREADVKTFNAELKAMRAEYSPSKKWVDRVLDIVVYAVVIGLMYLLIKYQIPIK